MSIILEGSVDISKSHNVESALETAGLNWTVVKRPALALDESAFSQIEGSYTEAKENFAEARRAKAKGFTKLNAELNRKGWESLDKVNSLAFSGEEIMFIPRSYAIIKQELETVRKNGETVTNRLETPLATVGELYLPVQNIDAFALFDDLLAMNKIRLEKAGSFSNDKTVWMLAKLVDEKLNINGKEFDFHILILNSHDGQKSIKILLLLSHNDILMHLPGGDISNEVFVYHKRNGLKNLQNLKEYINAVNGRVDKAKKIMKKMVDIQLDDSMIEKYREKWFSQEYREKLSTGNNLFDAFMIKNDQNSKLNLKSQWFGHGYRKIQSFYREAAKLVEDD